MKFEEVIKTAKLSDPRKKAFLNVSYTGNWLSDRSVRKLKEYNINDQHYNILRILKGRQNGIVCPGEIKEVLINKRGDLTRLLDKLVNMDLVERHINSENRRKVNVSITDKGLAFLNKVEPDINEIMEITSNLTKAEADELNRLLDKLRG